MASRADVHVDGRNSGPGLEAIAARAGDPTLNVVGVNSSLHKTPPLAILNRSTGPAPRWRSRTGAVPGSDARDGTPARKAREQKEQADQENGETPESDQLVESFHQ